MLLPYHPARLDALREPTKTEPWRVLVSGCLAAWPCGVEGTDYGLGTALGDLLSLPTLRALPFCPEQFALGTPRTMPDIHGGDGFDVLAGRARVEDEHGVDLTAKMLEGGRAMLAFAKEQGAELALLTDASAACGSQVISDGCRLVEVRRHQKGVGVATAILIEAGLLVVSQRDFRTLALLRARLDPGYVPPEDARDHHDHAWTREHLPMLHPRAVWAPVSNRPEIDE
jgi:uncharacterized protein YbbK (DUF523 family)